MRLFVAIIFPKAVKEQLVELYQGIKKAKWVRPEQIHLTLGFIGEVTGEQADRLQLALAAVKSLAFTMQLRGVGTFPNDRHPKVLWVGIAPCPELLALQSKIEEAIRAPGHPKDKHAFNPHITLARFQTPPGKDLQAWQQEHQGFETTPINVDSFHLVQSQLTPTGAIHAVNQSFPLA